MGSNPIEAVQFFFINNYNKHNKYNPNKINNINDNIKNSINIPIIYKYIINETVYIVYIINKVDRIKH